LTIDGDTRAGINRRRIGKLPPSGRSTETDTSCSSARRNPTGTTTRSSPDSKSIMRHPREGIGRASTPTDGVNRSTETFEEKPQRFPRGSRALWDGWVRVPPLESHLERYHRGYPVVGLWGRASECFLEDGHRASSVCPNRSSAQASVTGERSGNARRNGRSGSGRSAWRKWVSTGIFDCVAINGNPVFERLRLR